MGEWETGRLGDWGTGRLGDWEIGRLGDEDWEPNGLRESISPLLLFSFSPILSIIL